MSSLTVSCTPYGLGAKRENVSLLLRFGSYRFLLDCGFDPGQMQAIHGVESVDPQLSKIHGVLCSHAHPAQVQGLPSFLQQFPHIPIYSSEITAQLLPLLWSRESLNWSALHPLPWRSALQVRSDLTLELWPAGHIPGAALMLLTYTPPSIPGDPPSRPYTVLYTGDCALAHSRFTEGLPLAELRGLRPDVLIVDGFGGTSRYGRRRQQEVALLSGVEQSLREGRSLIFPVSLWGQGQEILLLLKTHAPLAEQRISIWVDPEFAAGCDQYGKLLSELPTTIQNLARHQSLFWENDRFPRVKRVRPDQNLDPQPIILFVRHDRDWTPYLSLLQSWDLWLPIDRDGDDPNLADWLPSETIVPLGDLQQELNRGNSRLKTYSLQEHCDGIATTQLIHNLRAQNILFIGGQSDRLAELAALEELSSRYHLHLPAVGKTTEFPVGDTFFQPPTLETTYEADLQEDASGAWLPFPPDLVQDPRWQRLADTGIVHVRWQGDELVLRGLSGRELVNRDLLNRDRFSTTQLDIQNCGTCRYYRGQRCWNQTSPLQGFKVSPEGYCPHYDL